MLRAKHTPDNKEMPATIEEDRRFKIEVPLTIRQ
jgi:hypothetical protein